MSVKIGKMAGIEVDIHFSWFIISFLVTWSLATNVFPLQNPGERSIFYWFISLLASAFLFLSVLVHELFHSIVARWNNVKARSITLYFFGGVSEIIEPPTPRSELLISVAGPFSSLLLGIFFFALKLIPDGVLAWVKILFEYASYINFLLAGFNMIPAYPMDGGRILRAIIWVKRGNLLSSTRTATQVSRLISYLIMGLGFFNFTFLYLFNGLWLLIIGLLIKNSADASLNEMMIVQALEGVYVRDIMTRDIVMVEPDISIQKLVDNYFRTYKHKGFPIVSNGELLGLITEQDVREVPFERWDELRVKDVMKPFEQLTTIRPEDKVSDALILISSRDVGRLPVLENDRLVGILTRSDIMRTIKDRLRFRA